MQCCTTIYRCYHLNKMQLKQMAWYVITCNLNFGFIIKNWTRYSHYLLIIFISKCWEWDLGLREDEVDLPFISHLNANDEVILTAEGATNCPVTKAYLEKHHLPGKQQRMFEKYSHVTREEYKLRNMASGKKSVQSTKGYLIPVIFSEINMTPLNNQLLMQWSCVAILFGIIQIQTKWSMEWKSLLTIMQFPFLNKTFQLKRQRWSFAIWKDLQIDIYMLCSFFVSLHL